MKNSQCPLLVNISIYFNVSYITVCVKCLNRDGPRLWQWQTMWLDLLMVPHGNSYCNNVCPMWGKGINLAWTLLGVCNLPFFYLPYLLQRQGVIELRKKRQVCKMPGTILGYETIPKLLDKFWQTFHQDDNSS